MLPPVGIGYYRWIAAFGTVQLLLVVVAVLNSVKGHVTPDQPRIVEHPTDQYVFTAAGGKVQPVSLTCKVATMTPAPVVTWYHGDGRRVVTAADDVASHRMLLPNGQLLFVGVDVAALTAVVAAAGSRSKTQKSRSRPGNRGGGAAGWNDDSRSDDDDDVGDIGEYYCTATNPLNGATAVSRKARLRLAVLDNEFIEQPRDQDAALGGRVVFRCKPPDGQPEPRVRWTKDGRPVVTSGGTGSGPNRISISAAEDHRSLVTLTISDVRKEDAGNYSCVASNLAGERASPAVRLAIRDRPRIETLDEELVVLEGFDVVLPCETTGYPTPSVVWRKRAGNLPHARSMVSGNGSLRINRVSQSDDGVYICRAENAIGSQEVDLRLIVHSAPTFSSVPQDQTTMVGRKIELHCVASGSPLPVVFWTKETAQTPMFSYQDHGRVSVSEDGTLVISPVQISDSGTYTCKAISSAGTAFTRVTLHVKDEVSGAELSQPPVILHGPHNQTVNVGSELRLDCFAAASPSPLTIRWSRDGRPVTATNPRIGVETNWNNGTLRITDIQLTDAGQYVCRATDRHGAFASWSATVSVTTGDVFGGNGGHVTKPGTWRAPVTAMETVPPAPYSLSVTNVTETSVTLSWRGRYLSSAGSACFIVEHYNYDSPQQGWVASSDPIGAEHYILRDLRPDTNYVFLVRSCNQFGPGFPSPISLPVRTLSGASKPTEDSTAVAVLSEKLSGQVVSLMQPKIISSTSMALTWQIHRSHRYIEGIRIKYRVVPDPNDHRQVTSSKMQRGDLISILVPSNRTTYTMESLQKNSWYEICVQPFNGPVDGQESNKVRSKTREDVPSEAPRNIAASTVDNETLYLTWEPISTSAWNGMPLGYKIHVYNNVTRIERDMEVNATLDAVYVHNIYDDRQLYYIQIAGFNRVGEGRRSEAISVGRLLNGHLANVEVSVVSSPWFLITSVGVLSCTMWLTMFLFSLWLYKKRKQHKKFSGVEQVTVNAINLSYQLQSLNLPKYLQRAIVNSSSDNQTATADVVDRSTTTKSQVTSPTYVNVPPSGALLQTNVSVTSKDTTPKRNRPDGSVVLEERRLPEFSETTCVAAKADTIDEIDMEDTYTNNTDEEYYQQVLECRAEANVLSQVTSPSASQTSSSPTTHYLPPDFHPTTVTSFDNDIPPIQSRTTFGGGAIVCRAVDTTAAAAAASPVPRHHRYGRATSYNYYGGPTQMGGCRSPRPARRTADTRIQVTRTISQHGFVEFRI